VQKQKSTLLV